MPLRVVAAGNRSDMAFLPLCAAGTREPSDWFPGPSCGQALRHPEGTRPVMRVSSPPVFVNHATAANEIRWFYRLSAIGYRLFVVGVLHLRNTHQLIPAMGCINIANGSR